MHGSSIPQFTGTVNQRLPGLHASRDVDIPSYPAYIGAMLAESVTESRLRILQFVRDEIPDIRRSRRRTCTTEVEKILVLKKRDSTHTVDREPIAVADAPKRRLVPRRSARRGLDEHGIE
jgi:hypothetical protein